MFLHRLLDPEARRAFAGLASHLLHLDEVTAREARVVFNMLGELSLTVDDLSSKEPFERLATQVVHPCARLASLFELVRLARVDGELSSHELDVIYRLAECWCIAGEEVLAILSWVERHTVMVREAEAIIDRAK